MTVAAAAPTAAEQAQALEITEAATLAVPEGASSPIAADGTVLVHVIRPGVGRGRGSHLYEADMLERHAPMFAGQKLDGTRGKRWKMFADHRSPEAKKAAGGLPRNLRDTAGIIRESWWDATVPADPSNGWAQGAVVARVKPVPWVRELIETDPELVETSISATATGVRPKVGPDGKRVWLVEGIHEKGSVDFVTEAGAGGRVAPLLEAAYQDDEETERVLLEAMDDADFLEHVRESRPELLEAFRPEPDPPKEDDDVITPEALKEALAASPNLLAEALTGSDEGKAAVKSLVEAEVADERERLHIEAKASSARIVALARMEREAHALIEAARLPDSWKAELRDRYSLDEAGEPTDALDVFDETGEFGEVTKPARAVLREALEEDIKSEQTKLREARPTVIRGQGRSTPDPLDEPEEPKRLTEAEAGKTTWGRFLQRSAGVDPAKAFDLQEAAPAE